jgi:hypothetical protein
VTDKVSVTFLILYKKTKYSVSLLTAPLREALFGTS